MLSQGLGKAERCLQRAPAAPVLAPHHLLEQGMPLWEGQRLCAEVGQVEDNKATGILILISNHNSDSSLKLFALCCCSHAQQYLLQCPHILPWDDNWGISSAAENEMWSVDPAEPCRKYLAQSSTSSTDFGNFSLVMCMSYPHSPNYLDRSSGLGLGLSPQTCPLRNLSPLWEALVPGWSPFFRTPATPGCRLSSSSLLLHGKYSQCLWECIK